MRLQLPSTLLLVLFASAPLSSLRCSQLTRVPALGVDAQDARLLRLLVVRKERGLRLKGWEVVSRRRVVTWNESTAAALLPVLSVCMYVGLGLLFSPFFGRVAFTRVYEQHLHMPTPPTPIYICLNRSTPIYTDLHRSAPIYADLRRSTPIYTDLHRSTYTVPDLLMPYNIYILHTSTARSNLALSSSTPCRRGRVRRVLHDGGLRGGYQRLQ